MVTEQGQFSDDRTSVERSQVELEMQRNGKKHIIPKMARGPAENGIKPSMQC